MYNEARKKVWGITMKRLCGLALLAGLILPTIAVADAQPASDLEKALKVKSEANTLEKATEHAAAAAAYEKAVSFGLSAEYGLNQAIGNYILAGDLAAALATMKVLADSGYAGYSHFEQGEFFAPLRDQPGFPTVLALLKENENQQTRDKVDTASVLNFADAQRFFDAFGQAGSAEPHKKADIYNTHYFAKASPAMVDYVSMKVDSVEAFTAHVEANRLYYASLRQSLQELQRLAPRVITAMNRLRDTAGAGDLPKVHFIVGRHTSAGTASSNGLLLGLDFVTLDKTHASGLPAWTAPFLSTPNDSLWVILHEYVHFLQNTSHRTVLGNALVEGGADFLANLVFGQKSVPMPYTTFGNANQQMVIERFLAEQDKTDFSDWTGNNGKSYDDEWVADLGYYVGEQIARGFYENSPDKQAAIKALLQLEDPAEIMWISGFPR